MITRIPLTIGVLLIALLLAPMAHAQNTTQSGVGGIAIDPAGTIRSRTPAPEELAQMRTRLNANKNLAPQLKCISLPRLLAQAKDLLAADKPLPDDLKYLAGLTQIQYIFTYPDQHDLLIAGPAEEWTVNAANLQPLGKTTGRPVLQFFDLVAAWRTVNRGGGNGGGAGWGRGGGGDFFGCSIDPPENVMAVTTKFANNTSLNRADLIAAMTKALGPQKVRIFGTPDDTRLALVLVAADYKLKRIFMGIEDPHVPNLGTALDDSGANICRFWFEPQYDPIQVTADQTAYALHGPRLILKAGALAFDTQGATPKAKAFAERFSAKIAELAKAEPAFADLQNIADLAVLAELIRHDHLDTNIHMSTDWLLDPKACPTPVLTAPRAADSLVILPANSIASGGVSFSLRYVVRSTNRTPAKPGDIPPNPTLDPVAWQFPLLPPTPAPAAAAPPTSPGDHR